MEPTKVSAVTTVGSSLSERYTRPFNPVVVLQRQVCQRDAVVHCDFVSVPVQNMKAVVPSPRELSVWSHRKYAAPRVIQ
jgi:hypothetical protein